MRMSEENVKLFYKLYPALLFHINQQIKKIKDVSTLEEFIDLSGEEKLKIRNALWDKIDLIDSFIEENPFEFSVEELEIIQSWKNLVKGKFYLIRYLKKHAIFSDVSDHPYAYGVVALNDEFERILGPHLPVILELYSKWSFCHLKSRLHMMALWFLTEILLVEVFVRISIIFIRRLNQNMVLLPIFHSQ